MRYILFLFIAMTAVLSSLATASPTPFRGDLVVMPGVANPMTVASTSGPRPKLPCGPGYVKDGCPESA
jgi:hypothetical protein